MNKHPLPPVASRLDWGARQIAGLYLLLGGLWILFSDRLATRIAANENMLATISTYKGWGYVIVTALLLYWLIQRFTRRLQQSEEGYELLAENITDVIWVLDLDTSRFRYISPSIQRLTGFTAQEVLTSDLATFPTTDSDRYFEKVLPDRILEFREGDQRTYADEVEQLRKDGTTVWVEMTTRFVVNLQNGHLEMYGVARDVSERKRTEEERRLWADAFEGCAHGIAIGDPHSNRIVVCNPAFASLHKRQVDDVVGVAILSLFAPADHEPVRRNVQKADQIGHCRFEAHMVRKDGSAFPVQTDLVSVLGDNGEILYRVATAQDISERKRAEKELQESEERYRIVSELTSDYAYKDRVEADGNIVPEWITDSFARITGYTLPEAQAPGFWQSLVCPEDVPILARHMQTFLSGKNSSEEMRVITKRGEVRWLRDFANPVWDAEQGRVVSLYGAVQDVTEYKRAEEKMRHQAHLLAQVHDAVIATDENFVINSWNPAAERIYGWQAAEVIGQTASEILKTEFSNKTRSGTIEDVNKTGEFSAEVIQVRKDGSRIAIEARTVTIRQADGTITGYVSVNRDITRRKQMEEERLSLARFPAENPNPVLRATPEGRLVYANPASTLLLQHWGTAIGDYFPPDWVALIQELTSTGERNTVDVECGAITYSIMIVPIPHARDVNLYGRDITERKQAEQALQLKDQLLHLTSEMAKVGGWEFDPETGRGTWTDEVAKIHDLDPDQETNVEIGLSFYNGESRQRVEWAVREAVELAKPYDLELEMITARGNHKWVRTMGLPILEKDKVVKVQGIFQDITERKRIEQALQAAHAELEVKVQERTTALSEANALLQALMDHMPEQIYFKDTQSRFIRNSRSQASLLGLNDPAEAVGKTDFDFFPHAARSFGEEREVMRSGKPIIDLEEWVVWPDGKEMWVSSTKVPLRNAEGEIIGIFGISHDITGRKRTEQAIRQLNADLEKKAEQLQAANKELEAFSYSVSHDLRAPLRAIDGYTRILVEDYEEKFDAEGRRICGVISAEARRMGQLIDDLLAFSRLGRKEMFTSKIDMRALAVSVFEELAKEPERGRIEFQVGKLPGTKGDLSLMHQVWANLLSNAIKFTSKKERALIEVGGKQTRDENIYYVRDTGAGFDMEYADKLFGVFQRLHGESEFEGTGVGLAIVQRIIRRHGGRVWAEGEEGKGATFYFALPRKENLS